MGVHGLWQLLSSTGKPVSLDSLEGKVLAVDVSVWLHQLSKGMRDSDGNPVPHAHLHGLFTRICKLLYYRIKPVFVFDGGVPILKKQTLAGRREKRDVAEKESTRLQQKLLTNLIRSQAVKESLGLDKAPQLPSVPKKPSRDAVFELPPLTESSERYLKANQDLDEAFDERRELQQIVEENLGDLNAVDVDSEEFRSLPPDLQHEIIMDMKERRKIHKMSRKTQLPEDSKDFSQFQVAKLLKQSKLTIRLDDIRKELNTKTAEISKHLSDSLYGKEVVTQRVISDDTSHSVLIKGLRDKKQKENEDRKSKKSKTMAANFPLVSEESSNSDELMQDSGSDERANMDFQNPDQLSVIGKAIINPFSSPDLRIPGKDINPDFGSESDSQNRNNNRITSAGSDSVVCNKPIFRPVIEIDTDSDSSEEDSDNDARPIQSKLDNSKKPVKSAVSDDVIKLIPTTVSETSDDDIVIIDDSELMDDVQANRDLQLAIEKSIKDQMNLTATTTARGVTKGAKSSVKSKSIFQKQISNRSVLSDEGTKSDEQDDKILDVRERDKATRQTSRNIFQKQISNVSNFTDDEDIVDSQMDIETLETKHDGKSLKRKSDFSDDGSKVKQQRKDEPKVSCHENEKEEKGINLLEEEGSSDSEEDFIEVKFDPNNIKKDDLFPASMFEIEPVNSHQGDNSVAMETKDQSAKSTDVIQISENHKKQMSNITSENDHTSECSDGSVVDHVDLDITNVIMGKNDTSELKNQTSVEKETWSDQNDSEHHVDEVFEGFQDDDKRRDQPDVVETRKSGSSISSLPDIVENTDDNVTEERVTSDSPRVPDLVKDYQNLDFQTLSGLRDNLAAESRAIQQERGRQERLAMSINDQMHSEAQELLRLFGVPYIVSPTEAEAQCAQLDILKLTQGTITDDSDIWLFGGTNVYRNFFNQQKHVEFYREEYIRSNLGLTREKLINLALLCGSDYTEGIQGVGPVTAMEILVEFPGDGLEGLLALKSWWEAAQKQYVKPKESKLKSKIRELDLSPGFPNVNVVEAYMSPTVDDSAETFSWGTPDVDGLRHYIGVKLGWSCEKVDEHLQPVLKRLQDKQSQRRISSYFQPENYIEPAKMKSKRLQKVVDKFLNPSEISEPLENEIVNKKSDSRKTMSSKGERNAKGQGDAEIVSNEVDQEDVDKKETRNKSGRSRGRGRGRGRGQGQRRQAEKGQVPKAASRSKVCETADISEQSLSSSGSESEDSELKSINSDDEIAVIERGVNVAEILGLTGFVSGSMDNEANEKMEIEESNTDSDNMEDSDDSISETEIFKNEGGFIREEDTSEAVEPQRTKIMQDVLKQLEAAKSKYFESETSQDENVTNNTGDHTDLITENGENSDSESARVSTREEIRKRKPEVASNFANLENTDRIKMEAKESLTVFTQGKIDYDKKIQSILYDDQINVKKDSESVDIKVASKLKDEVNSVTKLVKASGKNMGTKSDKVDSSDEEKASSFFCDRNEQDVKSVADNITGSVKSKATENITSDPIKQLVTGVPWANEKGKTKSGKGKARTKGRKIEPVEKIVKKSTRSSKGTKTPLGVVNLSESDSDSSD